MGAGAVEGSIKWWSRGHRAHHRYTDTDLDPYNAHKGQLPLLYLPPLQRETDWFLVGSFLGFWYSHVGWMLIKPRRQIGTADVSDLSRNPVIKWQHKVRLSPCIVASLLLHVC